MLFLRCEAFIGEKIQIIELKHYFVEDDGDLVNDWTVEVNQLVVMRANCLV